jgi:hypothetical protein
MLKRNFGLEKTSEENFLQLYRKKFNISSDIDDDVLMENIVQEYVLKIETE